MSETRDQALAGAIGKVLREMQARIGETFEKVRDNRLALEARVEALEQRAATMSLADSHKGVYQRGCQYHRGELCTHAGAVWLCLSTTTSQPGGADAWRLIVKAAR